MNECASITVDLNDCGALSETHKRSLLLVMDSRGISGAKRDDIEQVSRFIQHVWDSSGRAVVDVPCGGGKSIWSLAHIHHQVERSHQSPDQNSIWLVVDTLQAGQERLDALIGLGLSRDYIGFYHSFQELECNDLRGGKGFAYKQVTKNRNLCKDCSANGSCSYYNRYRELNRPVVIMCHEGFIRLLEVRKVPSHVDIIIDEEPSPYYMATFQRDDIKALLGRLEPHRSHNGLDSILETLRGLDEYTSDATHQRCTCKWSKHISLECKMAAYHVLRDALGGVEGMEDESPWEDDLLREHRLTLLGDLAYALRNGSDTYIYADASKVCIARSRMDLALSNTNKVIMLNGSASLRRYENEMPIYHCPDLKPQYPNVTLHCFEALPTKRRLKKSQFSDAYTDFIGVSLGDMPLDFVAFNKDSGGDELDNLSRTAEEGIRNTYRLTDDKIGRRGTIIGSNQWVYCSVGVVAMSLFTDIAHYALHASLRHGREIQAHEMFSVTPNGHSIPKVSRDWHLSPYEVDDEFRREAAHELYQTIMRLRCRHDPNATVNVVCIVSNIALLSDLEALMPGIRVRGGRNGNLAALWNCLHPAAPIANADFFDALGLNSDCGKNMRRAEHIASLFGVERKKNESNRVFWANQDT